VACGGFMGTAIEMALLHSRLAPSNWA